MAIQTINISTFYNSESGAYNTTAPSTITVKQGDTCKFTWQLHDGDNEPANVSLTGMNTAVFHTPSGTINAPGSYINRGVKNNAPIGTDVVTVVPSDISFPSRNINIVVESSSDTVPDAFDLGSQISNVAPSTIAIPIYVESPVITVSGLGSSDGASTFTTDADGQGGDFYRVNGGTWTSTSQLVYNGDTVQCRLLTSSSYNTTRTLTLSIGGVTDSWSVKTRLDPGTGERIPLGISSPNAISVENIGDLFGRVDAYAPYDTILSDYVKGGTYVPNISENANIPTSLPLKATDFYNSYTSLFFEKLPTFKGVGHYSTDAGTTLTLNWSTLEAIITDSDFYVGYGPGLRNVCEYRYTVTGLGAVQVTTANHTTWSTANRQIALALVVSQGQPEQQYQGTITFYARHKLFPSIVLSTQCDYNFFVYGN